MTVAGDASGFDSAAFTDRLAAYLRVPASDIALQVAAGSIQLTATVSVARNSLTADVGSVRRMLSSASAIGAATGVSVEALTSPVVVWAYGIAAPPSPPTTTPWPPPIVAAAPPAASPVGAIVGGATGGGAVLFGLLLVWWWCWRRQLQQGLHKDPAFASAWMGLAGEVSTEAKLRDFFERRQVAEGKGQRLRIDRIVKIEVRAGPSNGKRHLHSRAP